MDSKTKRKIKSKDTYFMALINIKVKEAVKAFLDIKVDNAVIAAKACFNDFQLL